MIKCSKCGFENAESANFCASCGAPLDHEKAILKEERQEYKCPKCGARFIGKQKFCNSCGLKFNWPDGNFDEVPIKVDKNLFSSSKEKTNESSKPLIQSRLFSILFNSILMISLLLSTIAIFVPFLVTSISYASVEQSYGLEFWFSDMWKTNISMYGYYIPAFIAFVVALGAGLTFIVLGFIDAIKSIIRKSDFRLKTRNILGPVIVMIYSIISFTINYEKTPLLNISSPSYILSVVSISLIILSFIGLKIYKFVCLKDKSLTSLIVGSCVPVLSFVGILLLCTSATNITVGSSYLSSKINSISYSSLAFSTYLCQNRALLPTSTTVLSYCLYCFTLIAIIFISLTVLFNLLEKKSNLGLSILSAIMALIVVVFVGVLNMNMLDQYGSASNTTISIMAGVIIGLVFLVLSLAAIITQNILKKKSLN